MAKRIAQTKAAALPFHVIFEQQPALDERGGGKELTRCGGRQISFPRNRVRQPTNRGPTHGSRPGTAGQIDRRTTQPAGLDRRSALILHEPESIPLALRNNMMNQMYAEDASADWRSFPMPSH